jgi:SAM-dependent methyltransferase
MRDGTSAERAENHDLLVARKDFRDEARRLKRLIKRYKRSRGRELLDIGCGSGGRLRHLMDDFSCTGLDANEAVLRAARRHVKGVRFVRADLSSFDLRKRFDVVVCLFDTMGYAREDHDLAPFIRNLAMHMKRGAVLVIEPWFVPSEFRPGSPKGAVRDEEDLKRLSMGMHAVRDSAPMWEMDYLVAKREGNVLHVSTTLEMGLLDMETVITALSTSGLVPMRLRTRVSSPLGTFLGVKR